jgi:hypothetical protein
MNANIIFQWAKKVAALCCTAVATFSLNAQNVGISPATPPTSPFPHPSAGLDVSFNNKGVLIPRVALNSLTDVTTIPSPVTSLLVYNNGTGGLSTPGYYYWNGTSWTKLLSGGSPADAWLVGGNNQGGAAGTAYIFGNMGNHHIDFYTNGVVRGRMSNLGEFFIGATNTALPGDLLNGVANATFGWAVNGYSDFAGAVYGGIGVLSNTNPSIIFGAVQGETMSSHNQCAGVRGILSSNVAGTTYGTGPANPARIVSGVHGDGRSTAAASYRFGVFGQGGTTTRSGGVLGDDYSLARGALGYFASNSTDYAVYGFGQAYQAGGAGGKMMSSNNATSLNEEDHTIGLGIYGGVMGGWIKGLIYGTNLSGKEYGVYVHGKTLTNNIIATLHNNDQSSKRIVSYSSQSFQPEITEKGKATLKNGSVKVLFSNDFKKLCEINDNLIINITPIGNSNGLFIESIDENGFVVKENQNGSSNISFFYQISGLIKNADTKISEEILDVSFEEKINGPKGIMYNDANPENPDYSLWFDGQKVRFDIPKNLVKPLTSDFYEMCRSCSVIDKRQKNIQK